MGKNTRAKIGYISLKSERYKIDVEEIRLIPSMCSIPKGIKASIHEFSSFYKSLFPPITTLLLLPKYICMVYWTRLKSSQVCTISTKI